MIRIPASEAWERLSEIMDAVAPGHERVILQRHGKDVAAVISLEDLERFEGLEDLADLNDLKKAVAKGERPIPWKRAKAKLRVR